MARSGPNGAKGDARANGDGLDVVVSLLSVLRARWLIVAVTTILCISLGAVGISMLQPQWQSSATLVINLTGAQVFDTVKGVNEEDDVTRTTYKQYYETQKTIIHSRRVAEAALHELGLSEDPVFLGTDTLRSEAQRKEAAARVDPVERLRSMISVQEVRNSRVLKISAEYPDPEIARDIANAVARTYVEYVRESRSATGDTARDNLEEVRERARVSLAAADAKLQDFKRDHKITSISLEDRQSLITQNIMTLSSKAKEAQARRIELSGIYNQAKSLHESGQLAGSSLIDEGERTILDGLRRDQLDAEREFAEIDARYGDQHPDWQRTHKRLDDLEGRIAGESTALLASLRARYKAAQQSEGDLERALTEEREKALELGVLEPEYRALEREARHAADSYAVVSRRDAELGMTARIDTRPVEILDAATVPSRASRPNKPLLLLGALVFGLLLGAGLALVADFRDHRIRGLADLDRALSGFGLQALGQLPLLPPDPSLGVGNVRAQRRRRDLFAHLFPQSLMAERCRGIRTSLTFTLSTEKATVLLVTSPSSAEGKSSTAMNLALSFCQARKRVCLVDADMRRPRLHQVFPPPVDKADIGLSTVLSGAATLDEALQERIEGAPDLLSVMTCGPIPANPAELLADLSCRKLLNEMRERFDVIIVDTPPVLPVTDPSILAPQVDGVVLVARCQSTTRNAMHEALALLRKGDTNLLGVILNEVEAGRTRGGYYGAEYYTYHAKEAAPEKA